MTEDTKEESNKNVRKVLLTILIVLCVISAVLLGIDAIEKYKLRKAPLWERAREMGEWEEVIENREIEDISTEEIVCMDNLVLEVEMYSYNFVTISRRHRDFFLFSDGSVYTAVEHFKLLRKTPYEEVYSETLNDDMWEHLDEWKYLGRISSDKLATIKVNAWQTDFGNVSDDYESEPILMDGYSETDDFPLYYRIVNDRKIPEFLGRGYLNISENGENRTGLFWRSRDEHQKKGMLGDEYAQYILEDLLYNTLFQAWQTEEKEQQKQYWDLYYEGIKVPKDTLLYPQFTEEKLLSMPDEEFMYYALYQDEGKLVDVVSQRVNEKFGWTGIKYVFVKGNAETKEEAEEVAKEVLEAKGYQNIQMIYEDDNCWGFIHDDDYEDICLIYRSEYYDVENETVGFDLNKENITTFMDCFDVMIHYESNFNGSIYVGTYVEKIEEDYRYTRYTIGTSYMDNYDSSVEEIIATLYKDEYIFHEDGSMECIAEAWRGAGRSEGEMIIREVRSSF